MTIEDTIFISGLKTKCIIGIFSWERKTKQVISLDITIPTNVRLAASTDSITEAIDYKSLTKRLLSFVSNSKFYLVETLAEEIANLVLMQLQIDWVCIKLSKPGALRHSDDVGIKIKRFKKDLRLGKKQNLIYISLGSNKNRKKSLDMAKAALTEWDNKCRFSSTYHTTAIGPKRQPAFWNSVCEPRTSLSPIEAKKLLTKIEKRIGRKRNADKFAPRCIDLDIIYFGKKKLKNNSLYIPHPDSTKSCYILVPMVELSPNYLHPIKRITQLELLGSLLDVEGKFTKV